MRSKHQVGGSIPSRVALHFAGEVQCKLQMSWFVYIVECKDKAYYTGICWNLKKRIDEHNKGVYKTSFTKGRLPVQLAYWEKFENRFLAARREK